MKEHISRRGFMKNSAMGLASVAMAGILLAGQMAWADEQEKKAGKGKVLIVYFSHTGHTRYMAELIHDRIGGELFEIKTVSPYPRDYDTVAEQAKQEQAMNARPKLSTRALDLSSYDAVFIGYPIWWGTIPMALFTFCEENDFQGKPIIPFCTYGGSGIGRSVSDLKKLNPKSTFLDGLAIQGGRVKDSSAQKDIDQWLSGVSVLQERTR